jgi:spore coat polysaccharide biosynthesis protein SpsF
MSIVCVVQARTGSTRLPGKVLAPVRGMPMLAFMLGRLGTDAGDALVVATTDSDRDDAVAEVAEAAGAEVVRGPEHDVLGRFALVMQAYRAEHVIRLTADCPLMDPALVDAVVARHLASDADYTTNVLPRTFPKGLDVEVCRASALDAAHRTATDRREREHVTPFLYRHPERFRLANVRHDDDLSRERWTVDTPADLAFVQDVAERLETDTTSWHDVLAVAGHQWQPAEGELYLRTALPDDAHFVRRLRNDADAVRFSGTPEPVGEADHQRWFDAVLADPGRRLAIGVLDGRPVGMVRLDVDAAVGTVSVAVDPDARGRGTATTMLRLLLEDLTGDVQVDGLRAIVSNDNHASLRLFERAGFLATGQEAGRTTVFEWPGPISESLDRPRERADSRSAES